MLNSQTALDALEAGADPALASKMATYHKTDRRYLGIANAVLEKLAREWRAILAPGARLDVAQALWASNSHESRIVAAKLLTQARITPDDAIWQTLCDWTTQLDNLAIAEAVAKAAERRVTADLTRLDVLESWIGSENEWARRAVLALTLDYSKTRNPKPADLAVRMRVMAWAVKLAEDPSWFVQKMLAQWLRSLSKHSPDTARGFLDLHGDKMRAFARREAATLL